jgi:cellulose synthase/poly-beta-1,6-N-acetylglucosamine synthase-like glycosyltransferase
VRAFLRQDYPDLQVILAYNTPHDLPVEEDLRAIAAADPRLVPLRIRDSVSKAQNVNAALSRVTGEFVGVFDADHHPAKGSFKRAWRWIASGVDVVQGHCVVRNGRNGFLQRLVRSEFEAIYAVAHPGRARVHGFGIFGGSNGYWRTPLLRRTRRRGFMLTEDIDSSMRVVAAGGRIVSDPGLVSTELAPADWRGLWGQRLRWAQGWSQVSLRHLFTMVGNSGLTVRQRLGLLYLLGWREVYPWISLQAFPILAYWFLRGSPPVDWFVPIFVLTTVFTTSAGIMQSWTAYRLARPELRRKRRWFAVFALSSFLFYTEYKNVMTRTAHLKEAMRERQWKVTPRTAHVARPPAQSIIKLPPLEPEAA